MLQSITLAFFFFNDTATTEIYTLSLHDALPISEDVWARIEDTAEAWRSWEDEHDIYEGPHRDLVRHGARVLKGLTDRKSTRLNSSHANISYAVFCLKKKKKNLTKCRIPTCTTVN